MAQQQEKKDFISKRVDDFLKLVGAVSQDVKSALLTASIILNFWLGNRLIKTTENLSQTIIEEVRKQSLPIIREQAETQLKDTKDRIDTTLNQVKRKLEINQDGE